MGLSYSAAAIFWISADGLLMHISQITALRTTKPITTNTALQEFFNQTYLGKRENLQRVYPLGSKDLSIDPFM
jgi:hypothetical protein